MAGWQVRRAPCRALMSGCARLLTLCQVATCQHPLLMRANEFWCFLGIHGCSHHRALEIHPHEVLHWLRGCHLRDQPVLVLAHVRATCDRHSQRYGGRLGQFGWWVDTSFHAIPQPQGRMDGGSSILRPLIGRSSITWLGFLTHWIRELPCRRPGLMLGSHASRKLIFLKLPALSPHLMWCIASKHPDGLQRWRVGAKTGLTLA